MSSNSTHPFNNQPISQDESGVHPGFPKIDPSTGKKVYEYAGTSSEDWAPGPASQTGFIHSGAGERRGAISDTGTGIMSTGRRNAISGISAPSNPNANWSEVTGVSQSKK